MKRGNEYGDLNKDDFEALENETTEAGTWQAASKEELATRKILRVSRKDNRSDSSSNYDIQQTSTTPAFNPFAQFVTSAAPKPPSNNSFDTSMNRQSLPNAPSSNPFAQFVLPSATSNPSSNDVSITKPSTKTNDNETSYMKKMRKLNESFISWAERQMKEKAVAVWKDGVKDYITHQSKLRSLKQPEDESLSTTTAAAPTPTTTTSTTVTNSTANNNHKELDVKPPKMEDQQIKADNNKPISTAPPPASAPFSFSFPTQSNLGSGGTAFPSFGGFPSSQTNLSFPTFPITPILQANSQPQQQQEDDNDDEGEPILPPEKILKNENDTDEILLEVNCKLFGFNPEDKEWKDSGKGSFRVTLDPSSGKKRMLVRNTMGKITFNAGFYKNMTIDQVKGGIKLLALVAQAKDPSKTEMKSFMIKLKESDISNVKSFLEEIIQAL